MSKVSSALKDQAEAEVQVLDSMTGRIGGLFTLKPFVGPVHVPRRSRTGKIIGQYLKPSMINLWRVVAVS